MADRTVYAQGTPCWVDLTTPDPENAQRFYGELFGWQFSTGDDDEYGYPTASVQGAKVAGLTAATGPGQPTGWICYLASEDVDETAQRIRDHGGQIRTDPMDVLGAGRMCVAEDPSGAVFGVWEAGRLVGAEKVNEPGTLCWNEVSSPVNDDFYPAVFGVKTEQIGDGVNFDYTVFLVDGRQVAGHLRTGEDSDAPAQWMNYFAVDDCDKAAEKVAELGGSVDQGPFDSPYGRIAVLSDPSGASFSIMQLAENPPS
ncbi:MAG: uncharacterized protein QOD41_4020 [Cryptosporangiaceae bacterium]|nr:uncharacterized protein [Cryptosporangiaceae bacterium]